MKLFLMGLWIALSATNAVSAETNRSNSTDFSRTSTPPTAMTPELLRKQIVFVGEIFVTDSKTGRLLYLINERRSWALSGTPEHTAIWVYQNPKTQTLSLKIKLNVTEDGNLKYEIDQYDLIQRKTPASQELVYGKKIQSAQGSFAHFAAITFTAPGPANENLVVRLTPRLTEEIDSIDIGPVPIHLESAVMIDDNGAVWAQGLETGSGSSYLGITTHKGAVLMSFVNFKGSKEIGYVEGSRMILRPTDKLKLTVTNTSPIIAGDARVKVYGNFLPDRKTSRLNSVHTSSSSKESEFLSHL